MCERAEQIRVDESARHSSALATASRGDWEGGEGREEAKRIALAILGLNHESSDPTLRKE